MEDIVAILTDEQQPFVGSVLSSGMPTDGARLRGVVGIHLDGHTLMHDGFIGNQAMQLSKRPPGIGSIGLPLLLARPFAFASLGSFSNACQVFQSDQTVLVLFNDAFGNDMIGVGFQPSLSSRERHEATLCRTSAFLLKTLSQSCIMVGFGSDTLARVERACTRGGAGHCEVTHTHIDTDDLSMGFWCGIGYFHLKGDQQVAMFLWLVVPQLSDSDLGTILDEGDMLVVPRVGNNHAPAQGKYTDVLLLLKAVVLTVLVGQGRRDVLRGLVQTLVALPGQACFARIGVLLEFGPQSFVGGTNLTGHATGHLRGEMKTDPKLIIGSLLQFDFVAHLAVLIGVVTHIVERVPIRQLCRTQSSKLLRGGMQFEFRG